MIREYIFRFYVTGDNHSRILSEVGNVTSERNGVTRYRFSHDARDVTIKSDNVSYEPRVITVRSDNGSHKPRAITMKSDNFYPQC